MPSITKTRPIHLIGIAGSGMRALADVLAGWDYCVTGSDRHLNGCATSSDRIRLFQGHDASHISTDTQLIVHSDAVPPDNVELRRAAELGIPAVSYFDMLGRLSERRRTVAVAGTHGKSTVTAMLAHILLEAGRDPTVLCGASPIGKYSGGRPGRDETMIVEACEYRENFLKLHAQCAAILNVEHDHFDCFDSLEAVEQAFQRFAAKLPPQGFLLINSDYIPTHPKTSLVSCPTETFGLNPEADWTVRNIRESQGRFQFDIVHQNAFFAKVLLPTPGRHNMLNALAAAALAWQNGVSAVQIAAGLNTFDGLHRRLETLGTWRGADVITDYAHHPTEIRAALESIRLMHPRRRVWCVFQPHQASRTARLLNEFAQSLQNTDELFVAEIFRARESPPRDGDVTAADLARHVQQQNVRVHFIHDLHEIADFLQTHLAVGDVLVTLGAGSIGQWRLGE